MRRGRAVVPPVDAILVVVPAHDEEQLLPACLDSVQRAVGALQAARPGAAVVALVVLDGCTDGSADVVAAAGMAGLVTDRAGVGPARRAGVEAAVDLLGGAGTGADRTWLACTDADSVVPDHWLTRQLDLADAGADVVVGTVRPRLDELSPDRAAAWRERHVPGSANGHVHGANLGVRLATYEAAGGFAAVVEHEDVGLVHAARRHGARVVADARAEVLTSGRLQGRTPGGYARHLREDLVPLDRSA
ncbi:glycosyltransferase [Cellulosimicrobium arenosum]|uniref:4,4'-diaponeurosporenoate glycosyltransferase n=1 Tax=Cellulosimicrobium arenosum TaxID=2708133 RepID=A0A927G8J7_9MICO|nr:glycosyltransferase [Cellulosimicrobium arenosum]MBD8078417.1 glycosyltransferase [Cellulosimicrobium arenosum]